MEIVSGIALVLPVIIIFFNGVVLGNFADLFFRALNFELSSIIIFLAAILPHAIIEIPALILSSVFGALVGLKIFFNKKISPEKSRMAFFFRHTKNLCSICASTFFIGGIH